jgi:hypothetical protein
MGGRECYPARMAYRDDRQALELQLSDLRRQNDELQSELTDTQARARADRAEDRGRRNGSSLRGCTVCGGALLPVAVFAGHNDKAPLSLRMSTMRFVNPTGGFTHSASILAKACSSCGFIHHFIDIPESAADGTQPTWPPPEMVDEALEPTDPVPDDD